MFSYITILQFWTWVNWPNNASDNIVSLQDWIQLCLRSVVSLGTFVQTDFVFHNMNIFWIHLPFSPFKKQNTPCFEFEWLSPISEGAIPWLDIMFLRLTHVVASGYSPLIVCAVRCPRACIYYHLFVCWWTVVFFQTFLAMDNAARNIPAHVCWHTSESFFRVYPEVVLLAHQPCEYCTFQDNSKLFSKVGVCTSPPATSKSPCGLFPFWPLIYK